MKSAPKSATNSAVKKDSAKGTSAAKGAGARPSEATARSARSSNIDLETVRELARIATELNLSEVEADPSGRIRVRRRIGGRRVVEAETRDVVAPADHARAAAAGRGRARARHVHLVAVRRHVLPCGLAGGGGFRRGGRHCSQGPGGLHRRSDEADERDRGRGRRQGRRDPGAQRRARRVRPVAVPPGEVLSPSSFRPLPRY